MENLSIKFTGVEYANINRDGGAGGARGALASYDPITLIPPVATYKHMTLFCRKTNTVVNFSNCRKL